MQKKQITMSAEEFFRLGVLKVGEKVLREELKEELADMSDIEFIPVIDDKNNIGLTTIWKKGIAELIAGVQFTIPESMTEVSEMEITIL